MKRFKNAVAQWRRAYLKWVELREQEEYLQLERQLTAAKLTIEGQIPGKNAEEREAHLRFHLKDLDRKLLELKTQCRKAYLSQAAWYSWVVYLRGAPSRIAEGGEE